MKGNRGTKNGGADESLVHRWSRRKHAARAADPSNDDEQPEAPSEPPVAAEPATVAGPEESAATIPPGDADSDLPTDADMPPIESLDTDSDYSGFMSPRVSDSLRRMALRKLFGMPAFNVRDGLDDYDEDFTRYQALGDTITSDMKYHAERLRARQAERDAQAERGDAEADDGHAGDADGVPPGDDQVAVGGVADSAGRDGDNPDDGREPPDEASGPEPDEQRPDEEAADDHH